MARPQVNHIKQALDNLFTGKIDLTDINNTDPDDVKKTILLKSIGCLFIAYSCFGSG